MTARISRAIRATTALGLAAALLAAAPGLAHADEVVAADAAPPAAAARPGTITAPAITAAASIPRGIVVANHAGRPVTLFAKGEAIRRGAPRGDRPVIFTGLTPGRVYTIEVYGVRVGALRALDRPSPANGLTVRSTATAGTVALTWLHRQTADTGGSTVTYRITAVSRTAPTLRATVRQHRASLTGLDPEALYTFTVTPQNSAGAGRATRATMTRPLGRPAAPTAVPAIPASTQAEQVEAAAPIPSAAPPPAPAPTTKSILVCPTGYAETKAGRCESTRPYTFSYLPYTFHEESAGPAPLLDSYSTSVRACPTGWNLEDYAWVMYCRRYGPTPMVSVKDTAPAAYTDDGTRWVKKDDAPAGYTDDGTRWIKTVAKEAVVVPA